MTSEIPDNIPSNVSSDISPRLVTVTLNPAIDQTVSIPNFTPDAVNRVAWEQSDAGGKGVNVASFLADFGYGISATGLLGQDNPELFQKLLEQKGIANQFVWIAGKTRVNVKIVDEIQQQVTDINFPGCPATPESLQQLTETLTRLATDHDWFILSGSIPEGVPTTFYGDLVRLLKAQGKTVVMDTSGESLRQALVAQPDVIKPNQVELQELLGRSLANEAEIVQAAQDLIRQGLKSVVVSMGSEGALFVEANQVVHAQPAKVDLKSTVGAGDAMVAGTVVGMIRGYSLADRARLATAFSMGALSEIGPRLPPPATVEANADRVTIRSIELTDLVELR